MMMAAGTCLPASLTANRTCFRSPWQRNTATSNIFARSVRPDSPKVNQSTLAIGYERSTPFGIDFATSDKTRSLKFNLRIDRKTTWDYPALFIGKDGLQPLNNPFVLVPARGK